VADAPVPVGQVVLLPIAMGSVLAGDVFISTWYAFVLLVPLAVMVTYCGAREAT